MIPKSPRRRYLFSILSGLILSIAFPFSGSITPLIFIGWVPLFLVAYSLQNEKKNSFHFFIHAYISTFILNIGTTWWIWNSTVGGAMMAFFCNALLMALALLLAYRIFIKSSPNVMIFGLGLFWLCFEFIHLNWELSWPWLSMGNYFSIRSTWIQWYEYTGILGGSLWVLLINCALTLWLISNKGKLRLGIISLILLALPIFVSFTISEINKTVSDNKSTKGHKPVSLNVLLLQPNLDPYTEKFNGLTSEDQLEKLLELSKLLNHKTSTLVIGPETALREEFIESKYPKTFSYQMLKEKLINKGHKVLIGASTFDIFLQKNSSASKSLPNGGFYESYNASLYFSKRKYQFIHKSKLVLGVEKIPFSNIFPFLESWSINNGGTAGSLGIEKTTKIFREDKMNIAPIVCYESIYGEFVAEQCNLGANLLCIITNDGWWGNSPGHRQHNSFAALRAIENRKYVVRSGNTGISSIFNTQGECLVATKYNEVNTIQKKVPLKKGKTFYSRHGDYLGWLFIFFGFIWIGLSVSKHKSIQVNA